jgi:hypothetical protein
VDDAARRRFNLVPFIHNSLLTKSPGSDSRARRERAGVRLWQWDGKESVKAN